MSRHTLAMMLLLASATISVDAQSAPDASNAKRATNASRATEAASAQGAASASTDTNASDAQRASSERDVSSKSAAAERQARADDAQAASSERDSISKSDAAAKRQAKTAPKNGDAAAKAAEPVAEAKDEVKTLSGISILGNQEAPKSLVIVPWKSSEIGDMPGLSRLLDDSVQPIDKEVFMRELDYYEIRSSSR